ncbi:MAG: DUF373 family protein [archaeon GBS-70-058]|nr:DUF373 family protein [Candidatus Culexarchaeum nevadense]
MNKSTERLLVICVDKDNDVGKATGLKTPIIGREKNVEAAVKFAITAPEDSDVNAIFAAIKVYDELKRNNIECEIATIAGEAEGGLKSDIKIRDELNEVLESYQATGAIFVSDGAADELIIPIIQSRIPIVSIKRIIIQQERGVEETYILFARYLRKIVEESQYARIFLGIPGLLFLSIAILIATGYSQYAGMGALFIVGIAFIIRGFSIDTHVIGWLKSSPIIFFSSLMGTITILISMYMGIGKVLSEVAVNPTLMGNIAGMTGIFIDVSSDIILIGFSIIIGGRIIEKTLRKSSKVWHNIVSLTFIVTIRPLLKGVAETLIKQEYSIQAILTPLLIPTITTITLIIFFTLIEGVIPKRRGKKNEN